MNSVVTVPQTFSFGNDHLIEMWPRRGQSRARQRGRNSSSTSASGHTPLSQPRHNLGQQPSPCLCGHTHKEKAHMPYTKGETPQQRKPEVQFYRERSLVSSLASPQHPVPLRAELQERNVCIYGGDLHSQQLPVPRH